MDVLKTYIPTTARLSPFYDIFLGLARTGCYTIGVVLLMWLSCQRNEVNAKFENEFKPVIAQARVELRLLYHMFNNEVSKAPTEKFDTIKEAFALQNDILRTLIRYIREKINTLIEENADMDDLDEVIRISTGIIKDLRLLKNSKVVKLEEILVRDILSNFLYMSNLPYFSSAFEDVEGGAALSEGLAQTLERLLVIASESLMLDLRRVQIASGNSTAVKRWGGVASLLTIYLKVKTDSYGSERTDQIRLTLETLGDHALKAKKAILKLQSKKSETSLQGKRSLKKSIKKLSSFLKKNKVAVTVPPLIDITGFIDSVQGGFGGAGIGGIVAGNKVTPPPILIETIPPTPPVHARIEEGHIVADPTESLPTLNEFYNFKSVIVSKVLNITDTCSVTLESDGCIISAKPTPDNCLTVKVMIQQVLNTISGIAESLQIGSFGDDIPLDMSDLVVKYFDVNVCDETMLLSISLFADREMTLIPSILSITDIEIELAIFIPTHALTVSFSAVWDLGGVSFLAQVDFDGGEYEITASPLVSEVSLATLLGSIASAVVPGGSTSASSLFNTLNFNDVIISDMNLVSKFKDVGMGSQFSFSATVPTLGRANFMLNINRLRNGNTIDNGFSLAAHLTDLKLSTIIQHIANYDISSVPLIGSLEFPEVAVIGASKDIPFLIVDFNIESEILSLSPSVTEGISLLFNARFDANSVPMNFMVTYTPPKSIGFKILPGPQLDIESILNKLLDSISLELPPGFPLASFLNEGLSNIDYDGKLNKLTLPVPLEDDIIIVEDVFELREPQVEFVIGLGNPKTLSFEASGTWLIRDYPMDLTIEKPSGSSVFLASACSERELEVGKVLAQLASSFLPDFVGDMFETFSIDNPCIEVLMGNTFGSRVSGSAVIGNFDASKVEIIGGRVSGAMVMALGIVLQKTKLSSVIDKLTKGEVDITAMPGNKIFDESSIGLVMSTQQIPTKGRSELKFKLEMLSSTTTLKGVSFVVNIKLPASADCSGDFLCLVFNKLLPGLSLNMKGRLAINDLLLEVTIPREIEFVPGFKLSDLGFRVIVKPPKIEVALIASLVIDDPALRFTGAIGFSTTGGATLEMAMIGCWAKPFAIPVMTICDLFIRIGVVPEPTVVSELHLGGRAQIGLIDNGNAKLFNATLFIGLNKIVPSESYFLGQISKLTIPEILAAFAYYPSLPAALDEIGFPDGLDTSYSQFGKTLPNGIAIPSGFRFNGTIQIIGFRVSSTMRMDLNGIFIFLTVDRFNIGNDLISVDGDGKSGPELLVDVGWNPKPRAKIDIQGKVCVLKICRSVNITIGHQGMHFEISGKFLEPFDAQLSLTATYATLASSEFKVSGYFEQVLLETLKTKVTDAIDNLNDAATAAFDAANGELESAKETLENAAEDLRDKKAVVDGIRASIDDKAEEINDQKQKVADLEKAWEEKVQDARDKVEKLNDAKEEITNIENQIKSIENSCPSGCSTSGKKLSTFQTPNGDNYRHTPIDVSRKTSIKFNVMACNDAHVILLKNPGEAIADNYQIVIHGWAGNPKSVIRDANNEVTSSQGARLSCSEMRQFWVSWANGNIQVGEGLEIGENTFLSYRDPTPQSINALNFVTGWGASGTWELIEDVDTYQTPDDSNYRHSPIDVEGKTFIRFNVMACHDAHLLLQKTPGDTSNDLYQIVIHGWSWNPKSVIRDITGTAVATSTGSVFSCNEMRPFWVSWANRKIQVRHGQAVGESIFLTWQDPTPHAVNAINFITGWGASGTWELIVDSLPPNQGTFQTPNDESYRHPPIIVNGNTVIKFNVKACNDAHLLLQKTPGDTNNELYHIVIHGWAGNPKSVIRDGMHGSEVATSAGSVLSCSEMRQFWVSWENGFIKVGKGHIYGQNMFMFWQDPTPHAVNAINFMTGWGATGSLELIDITTTSPGVIGTFQTPNQKSYRHPPIDVNGNTVIKFNVKACNDAHLLLQKTPGDTNNDLYQIVIHGWAGNPKSAIRDGMDGSEVASYAGSVLSCSEMRQFWVSWENGFIKVGKGHIYGQNMLMFWQDPTPHAVNVINFMTGWGATGSWELIDITTSTPDVIGTFQTPNDAEYRHPPIDVSGNDVVRFNVKAWDPKSVIREGTSEKVSSKGSVVSCSEMRPFWVSWENGLIKVGKGHIYNTNTFLSWQDPTPYDVKAINFMTGWGASGTWNLIDITTTSRAIFGKRKRSIQSTYKRRYLKDPLQRFQLGRKASKSFLRSHTNRVIGGILTNRRKRGWSPGETAEEIEEGKEDISWERGREAGVEKGREATEGTNEATVERGREAAENTRENVESGREVAAEKAREATERAKEVAAERVREAAVIERAREVLVERAKEAAEGVREVALEKAREVQCTAKEVAREACLVPLQALKSTLNGLKSSLSGLQAAADAALKVAEDNNVLVDAAKVVLTGLEQALEGLKVTMEGAKAAMDAAALVVENSQTAVSGAQTALDGVNEAHRTGLKTASFLTRFTLGDIINIKELKFDVLLAVADTGEFGGTIVVSFLGGSDETFSIQITVYSVEDMVKILLDQVKDRLNLLP
ncbi:unnamed protein product [Owenia fusiformis]|uniref:Farnesoic acid O-methyl transferase domain-containing protein n=1 Tax=Owenia fusiformis TaxID=6347 RepID=A0A8S4PWT4_OWEFU|nr:unnamed protein product [Owenia fusiformis]